MNGKCQFGSNTKNGAVFIGAGPQMGDGTQVFIAVALFLEREVFRRRSEDGYSGGPKLPLLPFALGRYQPALNGQSRAGRHLVNQFVVIRQRLVCNDLDVGEAGTIV